MTSSKSDHRRHRTPRQDNRQHEPDEARQREARSQDEEPIDDERVPPVGVEVIMDPPGHRVENDGEGKEEGSVACARSIGEEVASLNEVSVERRMNQCTRMIGKETRGRLTMKVEGRETRWLRRRC